MVFFDRLLGVFANRAATDSLILFESCRNFGDIYIYFYRFAVPAFTVAVVRALGSSFVVSFRNAPNDLEIGAGVFNGVIDNFTCAVLMWSGRT